MWTTALAAAAVSAALSAQTTKGMTEPGMNDKMAPMNAMKTTYTGCVETAAPRGALQLTHIAGDHDAMKHDDMKHDGMKGDGMKSDAMKADPMMHDDDHMMPNDVMLTGQSDLKKHVGQRVTVTGSLAKGMGDGMAKTPDTLTVSSLKVVAKSCS
jgi:hypothetical protein